MVATISADHTVGELVNALLPRFSPKGKGLYLSLRLGLNTYEEDNEENETARLHFIFERDSNYTKVWSAVNDGWVMPSASEFKLASNHDSCWRTDGLRAISGTYLDLLCKIRDRVPKGTKIHEFNIIDEISFVTVAYSKDPNDRFSYNLILDSIQSPIRLDGTQKN